MLFNLSDLYLTFFNRKNNMNALMKFIRDEQGLTAIEYVIAAGLLVAALTTLFTGVGAALQTKLLAVIGRIA